MNISRGTKRTSACMLTGSVVLLILSTAPGVHGAERVRGADARAQSCADTSKRAGVSDLTETINAYVSEHYATVRALRGASPSPIQN